MRLQVVTSPLSFLRISTTLLFVVLTGAAVAASETKTTDCLLVSGARIALDVSAEPVAVKSAEQQLAKANYGHEIEAGHSNVLAIRTYEDNGSGVDAAKFSKITLELVGESLPLSIGESHEFVVARGYYSQGGVGFIHKGEYSRALDSIKSINLTRTSSGLVIAIKSKFIVTKAADNGKKETVAEVQCPVRSVAVGNLNPWEGKVGTSWSSFGPAK